MPHTTGRFLNSTVLLLIFCGTISAEAQTSISAVSRIEEVVGAGKAREISIAADPLDEILSFPSGEYILNGRDLTISAGVIELQADYIIRSFPSNAHKSAKQGVGANGGYGGNPGIQGASGEPGTNSGRITIRASKITGPGRLLIYADGQGGGKGQTGGQGGPGYNGESGRSRRCWPHARSPTDGSPGGPGGPGGLGGIGGSGGDGGAAIIAHRLKQYVDNQVIVVSTLGGSGGEGGEQGEGGPGGQGGARGGAASCGGGGNPGPNGPAGLKSPNAERGPLGASGKSGTIIFTN